MSPKCKLNGLKISILGHVAIPLDNPYPFVGAFDVLKRCSLRKQHECWLKGVDP